ncbi:hypothetical protein KOR42_42980 [Thalassoglobus neptunius]|uniref:Uncharacterized protein n=1 Tax=Thalassoglobus neptunius TaxID=1938619 RepID=A0A5C5W8M2_9PLAN|nr:hypothetical protein [Thalassoglobus neptunius]TWT46954.1 hypothetical protein KOR42_42980 [Thalassoglobus neptunius]
MELWKVVLYAFTIVFGVIFVVAVNIEKEDNGPRTIDTSRAESQSGTPLLNEQTDNVLSESTSEIVNENTDVNDTTNESTETMAGSLTLGAAGFNSIPASTPPAVKDSPKTLAATEVVENPTKSEGSENPSIDKEHLLPVSSVEVVDTLLTTAYNSFTSRDSVQVRHSWKNVGEHSIRAIDVRYTFRDANGQSIEIQEHRPYVAKLGTPGIPPGQTEVTPKGEGFTLASFDRFPKSVDVEVLGVYRRWHPDDDLADLAAEKLAAAKEEERMQQQIKEAEAAKAAKAESDRRAENKLKLTRKVIREHPELAKEWLEKLIAEFPDSPAAQEARTLLGNASD